MRGTGQNAPIAVSRSSRNAPIAFPRARLAPPCAPCRRIWKTPLSHWQAWRERPHLAPVAGCRPSLRKRSSATRPSPGRGGERACRRGIPLRLPVQPDVAGTVWDSAGRQRPVVRFRGIGGDHFREGPDPHPTVEPAGCAGFWPASTGPRRSAPSALRFGRGLAGNGAEGPARHDQIHRKPGGTLAPAEALGLGGLGHPVAETGIRADLGALRGHGVRPLACRRSVELPDRRPYPHPSRLGGDGIAAGGPDGEGLVAARLRRDQRRWLAAAPEPVEQRLPPIAHQHRLRLEQTRRGVDPRRALAMGPHHIHEGRQPDRQLAHRRRMERGTHRADARRHHPRSRLGARIRCATPPVGGRMRARRRPRRIIGLNAAGVGTRRVTMPPSARATDASGSPPAPPEAPAPQPHPPSCSLPCGTGFRRHLLVLAVPGRFLSLARGEGRHRPRRSHPQPHPPRLVREARCRAEVSPDSTLSAPNIPQAKNWNPAGKTPVATPPEAANPCRPRSLLLLKGRNQADEVRYPSVTGYGVDPRLSLSQPQEAVRLEEADQAGHLPLNISTGC